MYLMINLNEEQVKHEHFLFLTSTVDHVEFIGFVQGPAVVLAVVQVVPTTCRSHAANTHLERTHRNTQDQKGKDNESTSTNNPVTTV